MTVLDLDTDAFTYMAGCRSRGAEGTIGRSVSTHSLTSKPLR